MSLSFPFEKYLRIFLISNTSKPDWEIILHFSQISVAMVRTHFVQNDAGMPTFRKKLYTHTTGKRCKQHEKIFATKLSAL